MMKKTTQILTILLISCLLGVFCGCRYGAAVDALVNAEVNAESDVEPTDSRQLFLTVLNAALYGRYWEERQEVAFADLPLEFKIAYDTSGFREDRGEPERNPKIAKVMHYDMDQDGSPEYFVYAGFYGAHDTAWMILTKKGQKWERILEEYGNLQKVIHAKGRGLLVTNYHGGNAYSYRYYELEKGSLVTKLKLDITYDFEPGSTLLGDRPVDIKVHYE